MLLTSHISRAGLHQSYSNLSYSWPVMMKVYTSGACTREMEYHCIAGNRGMEMEDRSKAPA